MDAINMPTPELIREAAKAKGLTVASLCRRADMDKATFYRWEKKEGTPTLGSIQKLIDALDREPGGAS